MKRALLLHNPGAGDKGHNETELRELIQSSGYDCLYASVKDKQWKDFDYDIDFIVIAGGDGTVRNVTKKLLDRKMIDKIWPIGLLPFGTANNIAKTLHLQRDVNELVQAWQQKKITKYDVGRIENLDDAVLFLESLGYGLFPYLMTQMKERTVPENETPEEKIKAALILLQQIISTYEPHQCQLEIDGVDFSGRYILLEIMNTKSIGPNLFLAPDADPGDGILEIVAVTEANKEKFATYVGEKIKGNEPQFDFTHIRGKSIRVAWGGTHIHVDDEVLKLQKDQAIKVDLKEDLLQFLTP